MIMEAAKHLELDLAKCSAVVQGFGNVGLVTARELAALGVKVVGASDTSGAVWNAKGLPMAELVLYKDKNKRVQGFPGAESVSGAELLELKCDILIPAAGEMQITGENAAGLKCKILAEGANGPTTPEADQILKEKGIFIIPDILANAGGVIVSYFEWVQDLQNFFWTEDEIRNRLREILNRAFHEVIGVSRREKVDMRVAALMIGVKRVARAMLWRGLYA